ncbi:MAG: hypothetical protein SGI83_10345 [Bacteroidota bacterium]|nr:hypothetical protein [Bacteroidota bacterium]
MKINFFKILSLLFVAIAGIDCVAQSNNYYSENTKRIDVYLNGPVCGGVITYPSKYKASKVKSDAFIVSFVNSIVDNKITGNDVDVRIKKLGDKKAVVKESLNGLIKVKDILLKGNYLRANIVLEFIDDVAVRSNITLTTVTHAECNVDRNRMMDFKAVRDFFIKDAKMLFTVGFNEMVADTIYLGNLTSLAAKRNDYRFNIPGTGLENWINDFFIKQYQDKSSGPYNYYKAPKEIVRLIKENKTAIVTDLLYSPNYFTSVNAMEALIYLASVGKVQLTAELNNRITQIKNGSFIIRQQGTPDVFYNREGYKELQMTDEKVIKKYSSSM